MTVDGGAAALTAGAASPVSYGFYLDVYGGDLGAESFAEVVPAARRLMRQLAMAPAASDAWDADTRDVWMHAFCAAADAFAEFGEGRVGGYKIGDFKVTNYMERGTTGAEVATGAVLAELAGTGLLFCGVS